MMSLNVSSASSVPQLINSQQHHLNNRILFGGIGHVNLVASYLVRVSLSPTANSQYSRPLQRRSIGINNRTSNFSWMASVKENVESPVTPISVPVRVAHELLQAGHRYMDVRTSEEFSAGHVIGAINIPYMYRVGSGMTKNANFVNEVLEQFGKDDEIIVGCQLGKRSLMAATDLSSAGFTGITDMAGGYAAWLQTGLPITS